MSIDYRDTSLPVLSTISLSNGYVEISASPMPMPERPSSTPSPASSPPSIRPNIYSQVPQPTSSPTLRISTIIVFTAAETSYTSTVLPIISPASSGVSVNSQSLSGFNLVAVIVLPILTLMIVSSTVLLFCRARQRRKPRSKVGSQDKPPKPSMLAALKGSFREQHKTPIVQHSAYFLTVSRDPSPTPEPRGRPNAESLSPQPRSAVVSDPPPPYVLQADSLRPPSMYGRIHTRSPSPTLSEANLSVHDDATLRSPFGSPYLDVDGDALSDISTERGYSLRRQRDADEISFVSALEPDEHVEQALHYVV
ncbi:MAG: hypothetical protein FRX48_09639 [Lasallia pustulata]|uniref:Uncharacterized protein n=1 Tax=Lasallia pustulata TaxID=136370 RepID=A0A5M8PCB7_9LECA|nr:MAG: hypothetical protein FRX48_09639 [Lasallia pustulata]